MSRWAPAQTSEAKAEGCKQRAVPLTTPVEGLLHSWLAERAGQPPVFPTRTGRRLSRDTVALRVSTRAATYMELDRRGAEIPFQVLTERDEKNSIAFASNESFC